MDTMRIMSLNRAYNEMVLHHNQALKSYGKLDAYALAYYKSQFDRIVAEMQKFGYDIKSPDLSKHVLLTQI